MKNVMWLRLAACCVALTLTGIPVKLAAVQAPALGGNVAPEAPTVTSAVESDGNLTVMWTSGGGGAPVSHRLDFYQGVTLVAQVAAGAGTIAVIPLPPEVAGTFGVRVTAINSDGQSPASELFAFAIGSVVDAPGLPTNLSAVQSDGVLTVQWTSGAGPAPTSHRLDFYPGLPHHLRYGKSERPSHSTVLVVHTGPGTSYSLPIPPGAKGEFSVQVTPFNGAISGPTSVQIGFAIGPPCTRPAQPSVTGSLAGGAATVSWNPVPGADHYVVSAGTTQGGTDYLQPANFTSTGVQASGLPSGFTAWVRVFAVNACGEFSDPADFFLQ
jgi:hypothetical protein